MTFGAGKWRNGQPSWQRPAHVERLQKLMKQWQAKVGDTLELPTENKAPERINLTSKARVSDQ